MLKRLHLENVGPALVMDVEFADRLNVFTGDNGLGKTFLLDLAWNLLTGDEPSSAPKQGWNTTPKITYDVDSEFYEQSQLTLTEIHELEFDPRYGNWYGTLFNPEILASKPESQIVLGVYARVDGFFSIFDSLRLVSRPVGYAEPQIQHLDFSAHELWNSAKRNDRVMCNGLISDWVRWQNHPDQTTFLLFWRVVETLFSSDDKPIVGQTIRLSLQDVKDIPTIRFSYGDVPITHLSAGMKRIVSLAYSLVWTWYEHQQAARLAKIQPSKTFFLLVDELELHLHPQWQRSIFPAILEAIKLLDPDIKVQLLTTTHSPLVLASLEPYFDEETDKLFGFDLVDREVVLEELPWVKLGEVDDWLTSPIFGLSRPRSKEAEVAINAAFAIMRNDDMSKFPDNLRTHDDIDRELHQVLPDHDSFWRRWVVPAEEVKVS